MRLSEAIRLGAMMGPQAFGRYFDGEASCAFGAAIRACGEQHWPVTRVSPATCPVCEWVVIGSLAVHATGVVVAHLNDDHHWTRERIADWVETIERAHEAAPVEQVVMTAD